MTNLFFCILTEVTLDEAARLEEGITPEMLSLVSAAHREPPPNYATAIGIPDPSEVESVSVDSGDEEEVRGECALSRRVGGKSGSSRADCMYTLLLGISATLASLVVVVGAQYVVGCETEIEDYDCILTEDENGVCSGCQVVIVSSSAAFGCMLTLAMVCSVVSFGDCGKCLYLKSITLCGLVFIVLAIILAKRPSFSPSYTKHSLAQATTRVKQCTAESKDIQNDVCWAKFRTNFCSDWDAAVELVCSNMTFDDDLQHPVREQRFEEILQNCTEGFSQFIEHVRFVYVGRSWVPLLILGVSITLLSVSFQSRAINFKTLDERTYP